VRELLASDRWTGVTAIVRRRGNQFVGAAGGHAKLSEHMVDMTDRSAPTRRRARTLCA
jgi:hypothetical protein